LGIHDVNIDLWLIISLRIYYVRKSVSDDVIDCHHPGGRRLRLKIWIIVAQDFNVEIGFEKTVQRVTLSYEYLLHSNHLFLISLDEHLALANIQDGEVVSGLTSLVPIYIVTN
jgi:hypothetical protein